MKRLWLVSLFLLALLVPAVVLASGQGGFDSVVGSIESKYHAHATRIPFVGLITMISRKASNKGVSNIHVATFESFPGPVDGDDLNRIVEEKLGQGWERIIRETSHRGNEQTLIFMRPEGQHTGLFVLDFDGHELDVVQVSVDPNHLHQSIGHFEHHHSDDDPDDGESD
jgi:hypothetical protein